MSRPLAALVATLLLAGCSRPEPPAPVVVAPPAVEPPGDGGIPPPRPAPPRSPDKAFARGVAYLLEHQSPDGAWRSDVYATFKDGTALTPLAVTALQAALDAGADDPAVTVAIHKGCDFMMRFVKAPTIDPGRDGFDYPAYTAALTVKAYSHASAREFSVARFVWVKYLADRQLTDGLGWKPDDKPYGGWGYCRVVPRKPEPNVIAPPLIESNLSATLFALDALASAKALDGDAATAAAAFVRRCQNWPVIDPRRSPFAWSQFVDGGFHFIYDDPTRNKAGLAHADPQVFHSYGSTTADGLRALALCNEPDDADRRAAAANWLAKNFRADTHPGAYVRPHEPNREAVYYYYAASVSRAFRELELSLPDKRDWAAELAAELARRQNADGSWVNPVELVRENDPVVATCNAVSALARCRR